MHLIQNKILCRFLIKFLKNIVHFIFLGDTVILNGNEGVIELAK